MKRRTYKKGFCGFTLIELLVGIAIVATAAAVLILVLNPTEIVKKGRDARRLSELKTIDRALSIFATDVSSGFMGTPQNIYVSLPDPAATPGNPTNCASFGLPPIPPYTYVCTSPTEYRNIDGSGWIPVNFTQVSFRTPLTRLPVDPVNTAAGGFYYTYTPGSWELTANMESATYRQGGGPKDVESNTKDGGSIDQRHETGNKLTLMPSGFGEGSPPTGPGPTVASVAPSSGSPSGGTSVTITGTNFTATPGVTFGGAAATGVTFVSANSLTATTPAHAAGAVAVVATNPGGGSGTCAGCFTYAGAPPGTTSLANGTNPSGSSLAPGAAATMLDAFTFQTTAGTDSITAVVVTLTAGTQAGVGLIEITNDAGTIVRGSTANPPNPNVSIALSPSLAITTTATQYKIRITPKNHGAMPAPPGASYAVAGTVTDWTGTNTHAGTDSGSATVTVDNLSPANVSGVSATPGNAQVSLSWTNPGADFSNVVILRATSATGDTPTEGTSPNVNEIIDASIVRYTGNGTSFLDTGLVNGTTYYYGIFSKDTSGNYSPGVTTGPHTPFAAVPGRYWIGGTGNWSDTAHWSASSGGAGGASVPTASDDVYFNASSFTAAGQTVTVNVAATANNVNWTGATNNPTFAGAAALSVRGSLTLIGGMTRTYTGALTFAATTAGNTITLAGKTLGGPVVFNGAGGWTLQDAFNVGTQTITLTAGSLNTNGQPVTAGAFASANTNVRTLTLGASTITLTGTGTVWNLSIVTNLTFIAGASTIVVNNNSAAVKTFAGGGRTYNNFQFTGAGTGALTVQGSNGFANFTVSTQPKWVNFTNGTTQTITGTFTANGSAGSLMTLRSTAAAAYTISAALTSLSYVNVQWSTAAGAARPFACGATCVNAGGNTFWNF